MIFNSLTFLVFIFVVTCIYWQLGQKARLQLIFFASLVFYGLWRVEFIPLLLFLTIWYYVLALRIKESESVSTKKRLLVASLLVNLGLLFYFKYLVFFVNTSVGLVGIVGYDVDPIMLNIILPLGISFYTFQTMSYIIDVYRGQIEAEKDFMLFACYVIFFPQLIAGPILRAHEVISQFSNKQKFLWSNITYGLKRIVYGLFLKVFLADNIAIFVDDGFSIATSDMSALDVWTLSFLFGFQIYFDFSAYSHIAIGSARLLGIKFPENFNFPYLARSPRDFWKRWHISLSSWVRDYLYLPLAGVRLARSSSEGGLGDTSSSDISYKKNKALFGSWLIMGLWHGANWTFVLWGLYHSVWVYFYRIISNKYGILSNRNAFLSNCIGVILTLPLMMLGWVPFRAETLSDTFAMWLKVLNPIEYTYRGMRENSYLVAALILAGFFLTALVKHSAIKRMVDNVDLVGFKYVAEIFIYSVVFFVVIIYLRPVSQYIYFQF